MRSCRSGEGWGGGSLWNGGGAFNNTLAGFSFEIVTYNADGTEVSQATLHADSSQSDGLVFGAQAKPPKEPHIVVEGLIITGKRLASEFEFARAIARLTPSYADDLVTTMGAVAFGAGPHRYVTLNQVGDTACDADEAWAALQQFAAPGAGPISDGQVSNLPLFGPVQHSVDAAHMKIVNSTLPGHLFSPGTVTREVVVSNGKVYIKMTGTGTGQFAGINVVGSGPLWGSLDSQIAAYVDANDNGPDDC